MQGLSVDALWDGPGGLIRIVVIGVSAYVFLVALLRVSGKRTLTKLNAFDLVITIALGSTLSSLILDKNIPFAEGALALAVLAGCQFVVSWLSVRSQRFASAVTNEPALLAYRGHLLQEAMKRERVAEHELHAALRAAGRTNMLEVGAVVLETDGSINVLDSSAAPHLDIAAPRHVDKPDQT